MALGGVTAEHLPEINSLGFGGVGLLGDIWQRTGTDFINHFIIMLSTPVILTVAGSDCSGGAGIQADISLTTDKNGNTNVVEVTAGTVYIKELSAPAGYKVDKTVYSLKVEVGKTATLKVSDLSLIHIYYRKKPS